MKQKTYPKPCMSAYCPVIEKMVKEHESCPRQLPTEQFLHDRIVELGQSFAPRHQTCAYCRHWNGGQPVEYPAGIGAAIPDHENSSVLQEHEKQYCCDCQYFELESGDDPRGGYCYFHAPAPMLSSESEENAGIYQVYPSVDLMHFCGQFKRKEETTHAAK